MQKKLAWLTIAAAFVVRASCQTPVVVISIDGMRPDYVLQAEQHGLKLANLSRFVKRGAYADGVVGVAPTVTYPSHTTLMTGVWPAEHGIYSNTTFDPLQTNMTGWHWYASATRVPTLWEAATQAGLTVASINWPVTVDARGIKYNIPEYWRARTADDRPLIEAVSRPVGWLVEQEKKLGPYEERSEGALESDSIRTKYAIDLLRNQKIGFLTLHLAAFDHAAHDTAPFSKHSNETLEALDAMIGSIEKAALAADPSSAIIVVSDHGFSRTDYKVNLLLPFIREGLLHVKTSAGKSTVSTWDATLWPAGGCSAVMLRDPKDAAIKAKVKALIDKMKTDPQYHIKRVVAQPEIRQMGGSPDAEYLIEMDLDYQVGYTMSLEGPVITPIPSTGMHGYLPDNTEMRASFFAEGKGIAAGRDLGVIDMRQIAPTIAGLLGIIFPTAHQPPLNIH